MILILAQDSAELAKMLDDSQLNKQIRAIAKILSEFNVFMEYELNDEWSKWIRTCRANYNKLVEIGLACCEEYSYRSTDNYAEQNYPNGYCVNCDMQHAAFTPKKHKLQSVIEWARDNVPQLEDKPITHMPITIPAKYWVVVEEDPFSVFDLVESHKKYYCALLQKRKEKKVNCAECMGSGKSHFDDFPCNPCDSNGYIRKPIVFTRRSVPDFLADLVR